MKKRKIMIVDDHKMFREGLGYLISQMNGFEVVAEARNGHVFLEMIDKINVDIVLMDISMPGIDGISATAMAIEKHPDLKIIILTMFCDQEYFNKMIKAGASGFLLKDSGKDELAKALTKVVSGEKFYSQKLLNNVIFNSNIINEPLKNTVSKGIALSDIEYEILKLICQGLSTIQISRALSMSFRRIEGYKSGLMKKTGTQSPINLAVFAVRNHLVEV
jgi:DNA-binding NarL/FixJ family response regulator